MPAVHTPRSTAATRSFARAFSTLTPLLVKAFPFHSHLARPYGAFASSEEPEEEPGSTGFWWKLGFSVGLVLLGGVFAGLTLGLMGLDELHLRVLAASSDSPKERKNASKVLRLMSRGRHWVLVVLLLGNVIVNESLPIFLDSAIGGGVAAVFISTAMIVIFGCAGSPHLLTRVYNPHIARFALAAMSVRYGLSIGAVAAPIVLTMMYLFAPIAWPTAKLLDWALGKDEGTTYKKAELKSFLQFHRQGQEPLRDDEISILNGVLELNNKSVEEIMTPMKDVVTLPADMILDTKAIDWILMSGYSRLPVHEPGQPLVFIGLLLVKQLVRYDPSQAKPVSSFRLSILPEAKPNINCFQALDYFQTGRAHLLLISDTPGQPGGAKGVVTLEDIIEEIITEEIVDETDRFEDNQSKRKAKRMTTKAIMEGIVERHRRNVSDATSTGHFSPIVGSRDTSAERGGMSAQYANQGYGATANGQSLTAASAAVAAAAPQMSTSPKP
ncbi:DUF21-domain-containing protein [Punctularia strigosozonata HHB-11173 SS5]|uniref:DUF21-domain-containing protein n=1 Tax=Punctularia strigosozonata (strain HHB-11173) TaxID=741275 RepID=UPI000441709E|nr:DUF21-domain-containing protein [Punctularia strigosozonata HHB-11173 SS5]EIN13166.1 DUF21-domain-containing protein [Punctularia strigosozonata HHB-11173 SS5]